MGFVRVRLEIGGERGKMRETIFLADTGSWYTTIPPKLAEEMGIVPLWSSILTTADKRRVEAGISGAYVRALGREAVIFVAIMDTPEPLLGIEALEALGLSVDPSTGELKPTRPYGLLL